MNLSRSRTRVVLSLLSAAMLMGSAMYAQKSDDSLYRGMKWRSIGPFRAGRVSAVAGIPGNAAVYYMASPGGGVWKTVDGGVVWTPIADSDQGGLDRRDCGGAIESGHNLRRHRRREHGGLGSEYWNRRL